MEQRWVLLYWSTNHLQCWNTSIRTPNESAEPGFETFSGGNFSSSGTMFQRSGANLLHLHLVFLLSYTLNYNSHLPQSSLCFNNLNKLFSKIKPLYLIIVIIFPIVTIKLFSHFFKLRLLYLAKYQCI